MRYRQLGRTGLTVSELSLGTASLGVDYGIAAPGAFGHPREDEAIDLVRAAIDRGITLIDTAPAYGDAERIVGRAVGRDPRAIIATKTRPSQSVTCGQYVASDFCRTIIPNLESSLRALNRDIVDILQVHNATREMIEDRATTSALVEAKKRGLVRTLGATVYDQAAGLAVIRSGEYDVLQVAFNALDQRMMRDVIPAADAAGVAVVVRSAFLKGVLTPKAQWLPDPLDALRESAGRVRDALAGGSWDRLPEAAMRFCLSARHVASVLTGARTRAELDAALAAQAAGPLDAATMARAAEVAMEDEQLLNPSYWPVA